MGRPDQATPSAMKQTGERFLESDWQISETPPRLA
jgi:hypothetical protein